MKIFARDCSSKNIKKHAAEFSETTSEVQIINCPENDFCIGPTPNDRMLVYPANPCVVVHQKNPHEENQRVENPNHILSTTLAMFV